ncbi:unnamed protein product [Meloidogyne enterolobii]|uniref:Uncharacterized protein n=1 Tax=Meloidogyne enterolobii TaxID=390850 RepID=A0ACB1AK89_MELEN
MVPSIDLYCILSPNFKLNGRAENVENIQKGRSKITKYQLANIYNPKVKFSVWHEDLGNLNRDEPLFMVRIDKMKEQD